MGIIKQAGDLVYTFRFLRLLTTKFEDTEAYKHGIIDINGKRIKSFDLNLLVNRDLYRDYYTPFHRLVFNIKKLMAKVPFGGTTLASYAAALYLLKEEFGVSDKQINESLRRAGVDPLDFLVEKTEWFVTSDKRLSPGSYRLKEDKIVSSTLEEIANKKDLIKVDESCYPIGEIFGLDIYEVQHVRSKQPIYVTIGELAR